MKLLQWSLDSVCPKNAPAPRKILSSRPDSGIPSLRSRNSRIGQGGKTAFIFPMLPFAMADALQSASQEKVLKQLLDMAVALTQLKFCPISPFADTRSRGEDGVYIDFGQDLGSPNRDSADASRIFAQLIDQLVAWSFPLTRTRKTDLYKTFLSPLPKV